MLMKRRKTEKPPTRYVAEKELADAFKEVLMQLHVVDYQKYNGEARRTDWIHKSVIDKWWNIYYGFMYSHTYYEIEDSKVSGYQSSI